MTVLQFAIRSRMQPGPVNTQAAAVPLLLDHVNVITKSDVVGGVLLPPAIGSGRWCIVVNHGSFEGAGAVAVVYPSPGERIGNAAPDTGRAIGVSRTNWYSDAGVGVWSDPLVS